MFRRPSGTGIRKEEKNVEEGVAGMSEDAPDEAVPNDVPVLDELVDSDLLRRASHLLIAFASLLDRLGRLAPPFWVIGT